MQSNFITSDCETCGQPTIQAGTNQKICDYCISLEGRSRYIQNRYGEFVPNRNHPDYKPGDKNILPRR